MTEFTLYSYQCCPIRPNIPKDRNSEMFVKELEEKDKQVQFSTPQSLDSFTLFLI